MGLCAKIGEKERIVGAPTVGAGLLEVGEAGGSGPELWMSASGGEREEEKGKHPNFPLYVYL